MIDADIYQIKEVDAYPFDYHECTKRASEELKNNARPQILDPLESIDEYDTIYLGCLQSAVLLFHEENLLFPGHPLHSVRDFLLFRQTLLWSYL